MKIVDTCTQVSIVELDNSREYLTKLGLHLNDTRKYKSSEHLFSQILSISHKMKVVTINLNWNKGHVFL